MNPNLLKQLAIVVKQGSLSRACEQLYITQPTLTRSIKQLEMKVGAPVLKRSRHGVIPTEIGARLAQIGERILADTDHGEEVIRQWHSGYHNEFTLGIDPLWEFAAYREMSDHFLREKRYVFHLRTGSAAAQIGLMQAGELDFLLAPAHLTVAQESLQRDLLFRDRSGVFAGKKSSLIRRKGAVALDELERQNWMIAGASAGFLDGQGELAGPTAARIAFTGSIRSVLHLLNTTDMLVRLPARLALMTGEIAPEQMIEVEGKPGPRRDIALWSRTEEGERPEILKVRELITELVTGMDQKTPTFGLNL
ncbi:LysR family transcriptional regulator [Marinobacterium mangrovicola]|uniref:DNA-binding transcriptional LysR family regulator n=1 Tax=Marinobacterium mangrovicola TaxID=1476959 RepID=A0A4R1G931_9GAMM|nr:LysR family transcriptional regulator [Marinobacterium mangrovicola]TCK04148.1 DNA-binding transcriptional LysR family regulator [Marinobacterium mangrovicola]